MGFLPIVMGCVGCVRSPVARLPEVSVPLEITPTPEGPLEEAVEELAPDEPDPPDRTVGHGPHGRAPDPPALRSRVQYELDLSYARGQVELRGAEVRRLPRPMITPRRMGRFAIELWEGLDLIERVRFDFPLLAAEEPLDVSLAKGLVTSQRVLVPATDRPTRALLVDRATNEEIDLPWPPVSNGAEQTDAETPSAGPERAPSE